MTNTKAQTHNGPCLVSGCIRQSIVRGVCQSCIQTLQRRMKAGMITRQALESILAPSKRLNLVDQFIGLNKSNNTLEGACNENN